KKSDHRGGTGPLQFLSAPLEMTLRDVLIFTIKESDNTASCLEVQRVGRDNINKRMRSLGLNEVDLRSDLSATMFEDIRKMDISSVAVASPANLMELVSGMARGTLVSKKASAEMLDILHRCNEPEFMGRYLPVDQLPEDTGATVEAKLSNKTGSFMDGRTDVGLVETEHVKFVLAVMTADSKDPGFLLFQHEGARMIGWIARVIYDAWVHGKAFEGRVKLFGPD
ncbi:MAG: serine hydrolase, partial [SAR202 cluster bacterium]|nr:serine hydrolase [SAR202 cluster bacterium]